MSIENNNLPENFVNWLRSDNELIYDDKKAEAGKTKFNNLNDIKLIDIYIDLEGSPNADKTGYYIGKAFDLISEAENYTPEGLFVWLPDFQAFGTWDLDHWKLIYFPGISWDEIQKNPIVFLNAQWSPDLGGGSYLEPWDKWNFKVGRPF